MNQTTCVSCSEPLTGKFCSACGEKVLVPEKDYLFSGFMEQLVEGISHFDSKFLKSFAFLIVKPGFLTEEYIIGRRKIFMKPIQIFAICSLLFFLAFPRPSSFFANANDLINGYSKSFSYANIWKFDMQKAVAEHALSKNISEEELVKEIHREASHKSKLYLVALIPVWGFFMHLLFRKARPYIFQSLIFTTHCLSFFILLDMAFIATFKLMNYVSVGDNEILFLVGVFFLYLVLAIRKFYKAGTLNLVFKSAVGFFIFILLLIIYRQTITILTINNL